MISTLGSLALVWLGLWCALTVVLRLIYPGLRPLFMRLHPDNATSLLLLFWAAPALLSLMVAVMLYSPLLNGLLISPHCHGNCLEHTPQTSALSVALLGIGLVTVVVGGLLFSFIRHWWSGIQMMRGFEALAVPKAGYQLLDSPSPLVFTLGWWNPQVFISRGLLHQCNEHQLAVILGHEQAHRERRDNLRLLLLQVFCLFLPSRVRQEVIHDLQLLCEQACDFYAAKTHGEIAVAETLVHVGRLVKEAARPHSMAFNGGDLALRVRALLDHKARTVLSRWQMLAVGMVISLAMILVLDPLHHGAEWMMAVLDNTGFHLH
jgi:hypothetical protein